MDWGVEMARKGGVEADRVFDAMPLPKLLRHLTQKRRAVGDAADWGRLRAGAPAARAIASAT
jgi:hypothetical protein